MTTYGLLFFSIICYCCQCLNQFRKNPGTYNNQESGNRHCYYRKPATTQVGYANTAAQATTVVT